MIELNSLNTNLTEADLKKEVNDTRMPVLIEFKAEWSGPSHILAPIINEIALAFHEKVRVFRVDVDKNSEIKKEFGIQKVPTLLFFKDGEVVDYLIGTVPKKDIEDKLRKII